MAIRSSELRIGNIVLYEGKPLIIEGHDIAYLNNIEKIKQISTKYNSYPLTEEILIKAGFEEVMHFTVTRSLHKSIGRDRIISIGCIGTPNEMIWLCERNKISPSHITDLVCIRNYDYDGKTYIHQLQNLHFSLTGKELMINL